MLKKKKKYSVHVSKHNSHHEKQVILLMILNYAAVKKLSVLLRGKTLNTMV